MTDLVGSTDTVARLGAQDGERWRAQHISLLREALGACAGREVQMLGDGILAAFESPSSAVRFAGTAQQRIARAGARRDALAPYAVRIGIAVGEVMEDDEGVHGLVVVEAARLCAAAKGGQVLATALVQALGAGGTGARFSPLGALELKGLPGPVAVVEVSVPIEGPGPAIPAPAALVSAAATPFVGRGSERSKLAAAWSRAVSGERRVALVAGEPGIGKTRLAAEIAREALAAGAIVLHGRCDEDLSAPFQPWVQSLRHYLAHADPGALRADLAETAADLVRVVPEVSRFVSDLPASDPDPESARLRLFEAIDGLLASASRSAPVLVVLDDLHWADKPSLVLLRHLVRSARPAALLLLGTYRETDLARTHPLAETLADLRREPLVERLLLRGLAESETAALLAARAEHDVAEAFVRAVHSETDGNPFFVEEVLRHLAETGALRREGGRWTSDRRIEDLGIPEGVREVVGRRLSRLSETANQALGVAAVIGRDFDAQTIEAAGGPSGDALLDALDEAARARLIEEAAAPGQYAFSHALVRQTLYEELGTTRRVRVHWRIGDALERRFASAPEEHLAAIAHHLCEGALAGDPLRAVDAALRAARHAATLVAHEAQISRAESGLALLDQAGLDEPERRYELLMSLGEGRLNVMGNFSAAYDEAARLARREGWAVRQARAVFGATSIIELGMVWESGYRQVFEEALEALPAGDGVERCILLSRLAMIAAVAVGEERARALADEAIAMARRLGGLEELTFALGAKYFLLLGTHHVAELEATGAEQRAAAAGGHPRPAALASRQLVAAAMLRGDRAAFDRYEEEKHRALNRWRIRSGMIYDARAAVALATGDFAAARALASKTRDLYGNSGIGRLSFGAVVIAARYEEGRLAQVAEAVEPFVASMPRWAQAYACLGVSARAALGQVEPARAELRRLAADDFGVLPRDWGWPLSLRHLAEACALLGDAAVARALEPLVSPYSGLFLVAFGNTVIEGAADRAIGQVLATQGRLDEAAGHYERALALEEGFGATALAARTRYWLARALGERSAPGDLERAQVLAEESRATAASLGMAHVESSARSLLAEAPPPRARARSGSRSSRGRSSRGTG
jgi:tetratricopeptide (TPR) repeat protein